MKKILSLLAAVGLTSNVGLTVVSCGNENPNENQLNRVSLVVTLTQGTEKISVIKKIQALEIKASGLVEDKTFLITNAAVGAVSALEGVHNVSGTPVTNSSRVAFEQFEITVNVSFTAIEPEPGGDQLTNINTLEGNLGELISNSESSIIIGFMQKNPEVSQMDMLDFYLEKDSITTTKAKLVVSPSSKKYQGTLDLNFTIAEKN